MRIEYFSSALASDRKRAWEQFVDDAFGAVDMNITNAQAFNGEIRKARLGELELNEVVSDFEIASRTRVHIARDRKEYFILLLLRDGSLSIEQGGRQCRLLPGSFGLMDLNTPYQYGHAQRTSVLGISIPSAILNSLLPDPHRHCMTPKAATVGTGRIIADFLQSFAGQLDQLPDHHAGLYAGRIVDLIGLLLDTESGGAPSDQHAMRNTIFARCTHFIESHISDPNLGPEKVAAAAGISLRYVHKVFQPSGETVNDFIRRVRLRRAYDELTRPGNYSKLIKEIAFNGGFRSQSHFTKLFREAFGATPRRIRGTPS